MINSKVSTHFWKRLNLSDRQKVAKSLFKNTIYYKYDAEKVELLKENKSKNNFNPSWSIWKKTLNTAMLTIWPKTFKNNMFLIFPHNIYGFLFSCPWVCRGWLMESCFSTPPCHQDAVIVVMIVFVFVALLSSYHW